MSKAYIMQSFHEFSFFFPTPHPVRAALGKLIVEALEIGPRFCMKLPNIDELYCVFTESPNHAF